MEGKTTPITTQLSPTCWRPATSLNSCARLASSLSFNTIEPEEDTQIDEDLTAMEQSPEDVGCSPITQRLKKERASASYSITTPYWLITKNFEHQLRMKLVLGMRPDLAAVRIEEIYRVRKREDMVRWILNLLR